MARSGFHCPPRAPLHLRALRPTRPRRRHTSAARRHLARQVVPGGSPRHRRCRRYPHPGALLRHPRKDPHHGPRPLVDGAVPPLPRRRRPPVRAGQDHLDPALPEPKPLRADAVTFHHLIPLPGLQPAMLLRPPARPQDRHPLQHIPPPQPNCHRLELQNKCSHKRHSQNKKFLHV